MPIFTYVMAVNSSAHFIPSGVFIQLIFRYEYTLRSTRFFYGVAVHKVPRSHTIRHKHINTNTHTVGHLWPSDHLVAKTVTYTKHKEHEKRTSTPSAGIWTHHSTN